MRIKGIYLMDIMTTLMAVIVVIATIESFLWDKNWSIQRNYLNIIFLMIIALMKYSTHVNYHYIPHGVFAFATAHFILAFERDLQFEQVPKFDNMFAVVIVNEVFYLIGLSSRWQKFASYSISWIYFMTRMHSLLGSRNYRIMTAIFV
jgi:hypothetical protein